MFIHSPHDGHGPLPWPSYCASSCCFQFLRDTQPGAAAAGGSVLSNPRCDPQATPITFPQQGTGFWFLTFGQKLSPAGFSHKQGSTMPRDPRARPESGDTHVPHSLARSLARSPTHSLAADSGQTVRGEHTDPSEQRGQHVRGRVPTWALPAAQRLHGRGRGPDDRSCREERQDPRLLHRLCLLLGYRGSCKGPPVSFLSVSTCFSSSLQFFSASSGPSC